MVSKIFQKFMFFYIISNYLKIVIAYCFYFKYTKLIHLVQTTVLQMSSLTCPKFIVLFICDCVPLKIVLETSFKYLHQNCNNVFCNYLWIFHPIFLGIILSTSLNLPSDWLQTICINKFSFKCVVQCHGLSIC